MSSRSQRWGHRDRERANDPSVFIQHLGDAAYIYVCYLDRGRITHDEVLCRACYDLLEARGAFDESKLARGKSIQIHPSTARECNACDGTGLVLPTEQVRR